MRSKLFLPLAAVLLVLGCFPASAKLRIDPGAQVSHEHLGVVIDAFPFRANLVLVDRYSHDNGVRFFQPILTFNGLTPRRPGQPVAAAEDPAVPALGFNGAALAAELRDPLKELRKPKKGTAHPAFSQGTGFERQEYPVECSYLGAPYKNDEPIELTLRCLREDGSVAPYFHLALPPSLRTLTSRRPLRAYLTSPYERNQAEVSVHMTAFLRETDGVVPRMSVELTTNAEPYLPEFAWGDNLKIVGYQPPVVGPHFDELEALKLLSNSSTLYTLVSKAPQLAAVKSVGDIWTAITPTPAGLALTIGVFALQYSIQDTVRNNLDAARDKAEGQVKRFAIDLARSMAKSKYYAEIYPYQKELYAFQFITAASGRQLGNRRGDTYLCSFMACQDFDSGLRLAVLPPASKKTSGLRSLWQIQENGTWTEICRNTCPGT